MCINLMQGLQLGGTLMQGVGGLQYGRTQAAMAEADAAAERDAAQQEARKIMRAAAKRKGAARAATAASGATLDNFALGVEQEIDQFAEEDAAMTILGAKRRGDVLRTQGKYAKAAGQNQFASSLIQGGYQAKGWRGTKAAVINSVKPVYTDPYEQWLRNGGND